MEYDNLAVSGGTQFNQGAGTGALLGGYGQWVWRQPGNAWLMPEWRCLTL